MLKAAYSVLPDRLKIEVRRLLDNRVDRKLLRAEERLLVREGEWLSDHGLADVLTREDWRRRQPISRQRLRWMLGLDPWPERTPLKATITGTIKQADCRIEKVVFESRPGLFVTANFYVPQDAPGPLPCVIYLNGHSTALDGAKTAHQTPSLWYPANGFALLVVDPLGFGEIPGIHAGTHRLNWWHWLSQGYTPAGVEVWNAMRALDWLETRPEIDSARIGVTGLSGGGVMTQYLAALDDRVAAAAPSCSTYTLGTQVALGLIPRQCDCTFYPNVYRMDFPEVLALIAPRPLLILGGRKDPIFPPVGFGQAYRRTKRIYDLFDEQDEMEPRIQLVQTDAGHTDTPASLVKTHQWMCRWLRDRAESSSRLERPKLLLESPETLRCLKETSASAVNDHVHDVWFAPSPAVPLDRGEWESRKKDLSDILRTRIFGWFPPGDIPFRTRRIRANGGYADKFAEFGAFEFDSEPGVPVRAYLLQPRERSGPVPLVVWIKRPEEHVHFPDVDEFHALLRSHAVLVLTPRFAARPLSGRAFTRIERTAAVVGRSVAAMRVWDVRRAVAWALLDRRLAISETTVYGCGEAGLAGLYAAVLDPAIEHVVLREPPTSHLTGFALPTILRDTDVDEVAGLLAPRRLTLLAAPEGTLACTRAIYELTGAGQAFGRAPSLPKAISRSLRPVAVTPGQGVESC
ncbi:MAG: acetylxylan esterase [Kiritimatiellae bacterium]|nr:acetylxylan esterase [Kiritimatiellia bacterium]MDD4340696.1 acetylxylan esterase [Kiritimatiellia bacterium]